MDIDRRAFLASVGGLAVVERLDDEAKAETLEHYMMDLQDGGHAHEGLIVGGEAQVAAAAPDPTIRRGAGSLFGPQGPAENRKMAQLAPMSSKSTLLEFFEKRFAALLFGGDSCHGARSYRPCARMPQNCRKDSIQVGYPSIPSAPRLRRSKPEDRP